MLLVLFASACGQFARRDRAEVCNSKDAKCECIMLCTEVSLKFNRARFNTSGVWLNDHMFRPHGVSACLLNVILISSIHSK